MLFKDIKYLILINNEFFIFIYDVSRHKDFIKY